MWQGAQTIGGEPIICKNSKCFFGVQEVEYVGQILSREGVKVEPNKIKAIKEWKIPTTIKHIWGFLKVDRALSQFF